jgi:hypothetical protein
VLVSRQVEKRNSCQFRWSLCKGKVLGIGVVRVAGRIRRDAGTCIEVNNREVSTWMAKEEKGKQNIQQNCHAGTFFMSVFSFAR